MPVFVHDQHAKPIASVEQFRGGRIVGTAVGVRAHLLELAYSPLQQAVRHSDSDPGKILMIARSLNLDRFAVQEQSLLSIEPKSPYPERRCGRIDLLPALLDACHDPI